jgi:hypothetical protein
LQLLAGDHLSGTLQQHRQNPKRLFLQGQSSPVFVHLAGAQVNLEKPGLEFAAGAGRRSHISTVGRCHLTSVAEFRKGDNSLSGYCLASQD